MKKLLICLILAVTFASCYDDFRLDYEYSSVAFSNADGGSNEPGVLWRTVVKGEGLNLNAGIYLAGILDNGSERWADYEIDPTLLEGTDYELMPSNYYSLSNTSRFVIPAGETVGTIGVTLDSISFLNDPLTVENHYAIPFRLLETSEDSILSSQSTQILVVKYMNQYQGYYNQTGTFETLNDDETVVLNSGNIDNVVTANTVVLDSIETNGTMHLLGDDYKMKMLINPDNTVSLQYSPNLNADNSPKNIALDAAVSSSYVTAWNSEEAVQSGTDPASSAFTDQILSWGNYGGPAGEGGEFWIQYTFLSPHSIGQSEAYWAADGGGVQIPTNSYVMYWDLDTEEWKLLSSGIVVNGTSVDGSVYGTTNVGNTPDIYNVTTFDNITTDKIRIYSSSPTFTGMHEWRVWGVPAPTGYETAPIYTIVENGENTYDPETGTFNLNYRVNYNLEDLNVEQEYHTNVSATLVWRNRIRDGVNEWRR